jgi:D-arginine dehydrogenase
MTTEFDIIVIGAGIAGASIAAHLAETSRVLILEMEERPGFHSTGRSAAAYVPNYGPAPIRALTRASHQALESFGVMVPRHTIFLMPPDQREAFDRLMAIQQGMREISFGEAKAIYPLLRRDYAERFGLDPATSDIDVDLHHQNYLRRYKQRGGTLLCEAVLQSLERTNGAWTAVTPKGSFRSPTIVNAAGAWGDEVARLAGARPVGLQPKRRSMAVVPAPAGMDPMPWPFLVDAAETWYSKPQGGKLLVSPADQTPVEPHDAYADDMALAEGIDRFQQAVEFEVTRVERTWGGLRSFAPDGNPVCGYDPRLEGFFWLVGQGGYGIQTSPALSRLAAALVRHDAPPTDILDEGLIVAGLLPGRFG